MDFRLGERSDAFRAEAREFLAEALTPELEERMYRHGVSHDEEFTRRLRDRGWLAPGWPVEWGGQGRDALEILAFGEEMSRAEAPGYAIGTTMMVSRIIQVVGTERQKEAILPRALRGEIVIVLGFSEPESGSDVAAAQTRAVRDGEEWVINGQKMFTTNAHIADYVFLLTRTNPDAPKHKGLTMFLVPMKQPGVEVQAVFTLSGERTNISYYADVRVSDAWRIGGVDEGWRVMTKSLQEEHSGGFASHSERLLGHAESWARATPGPDGRPRIEDPDVRRRLARVATETEVGRLLQHRSVWMAHEGMVPEAEGPMTKLFSSEAMQRHAQEVTEMLGPDGLRSYFEPSAPEGGKIEHLLRFSLGTTIYGGTSEIQRTIIAQRGLGLPKPT
ncbi:MAG TPA: acyl-CoA dehydrogenase family protein [Acidimicrobiales bacterium]